ncbi:hypothetical protein [Desulfofundulus kuznetsovii]
MNGTVYQELLSFLNQGYTRVSMETVRRNQHGKEVVIGRSHGIIRE